MKERRTSARVRMVIDLCGQAVRLGAPISLVDISMTGMAIRTELALPVDAEHVFDLRLHDGSVVRLDGQVVDQRLDKDGRHYIVAIRFSEFTPIADAFDRIAADAGRPGAH